MTWKGAGGSEIVSQSRQVNFSRTVCRTNQRRGTTSRVSVTTSPILASRLPPQQRQVVGRRNHDPLARQMLRQRPASGLLPDMRRHDRAGFRLGGLGRRLVLGRGLLELGQLELELVDEPLAALAGLPELLAPGLGQQQLRRSISSLAPDIRASALRARTSASSRASRSARIMACAAARSAGRDAGSFLTASMQAHLAAILEVEMTIEQEQ